jgi:hypothetical protein
LALEALTGLFRTHDASWTHGGGWFNLSVFVSADAIAI